MYTAKARDRVRRAITSEKHQKGCILELLTFSKRRACRPLEMQKSTGSCWKEPKDEEREGEGLTKQAPKCLAVTLTKCLQKIVHE